MMGRIQEAGKGGAIHRQTRVFTRSARCDQLVATYTHMRIHNSHSLSLSLSLPPSLSLSLSHLLTHLKLLLLLFKLLFTFYYYTFSFFNYYYFFMLLFFTRGENAFYAYSQTSPVSYVGLEY